LKLSVMPWKVTFFRTLPLLVSLISQSFNTLLRYSHHLQSHMKKLHLPSPKYDPAKPQAQITYLCIFWSLLAGCFLNTYSPCSKPLSIFLTTPFISSSHQCCPKEARPRGLLCPCCLATCCIPEHSGKCPRNCHCLQDHCHFWGARPAATSAQGSPSWEVNWHCTWYAC
jgi:hypothetical protein